jgi:hypothetical protein
VIKKLPEISGLNFLFLTLVAKYVKNNAYNLKKIELKTDDKKYHYL